MVCKNCLRPLDDTDEHCPGCGQIVIRSLQQDKYVYPPRQNGANAPVPSAAVPSDTRPQEKYVYPPRHGRSVTPNVPATPPSATMAQPQDKYTYPPRQERSVPHTTAHVPNEHSLPQGDFIQPPRPVTQEDSSPLSQGQWVLTIFLTLLPVAGLVLLFVWAFGDNNINRKRYARAILIIYGCLLVFYAMIIGGIAAFTTFIVQGIPTEESFTALAGLIRM